MTKEEKQIEGLNALNELNDIMDELLGLVDEIFPNEKEIKQRQIEEEKRVFLLQFAFVLFLFHLERFHQLNLITHPLYHLIHLKHLNLLFVFLLSSFCFD